MNHDIKKNNLLRINQRENVKVSTEGSTCFKNMERE